MANRSAEKSWLYHIISSRTFAATIIIVLLLGLSAASWLKIPVEVMPKENTPPFMFVRVDSKDSMAPERMELALTLPVEGAIRTLTGLSKFTSSTNGRGLSLSLTYRPRTDMDLAAFNLQEALQDLEAHGILDMRGVSISKLNPESPAVIKLAVVYGFDTPDPAQTIKEDFRLGLEAIPEISKVEINGIEPLEYQYNIPYARAQEFGLEGDGLSAFLKFQPMREPLGQASFGSERFVTAVNARLLPGGLSDLQNQTLGRSSGFTLRDVASEKIIDRSKEQIARKNGEPAVFVEIFAKEGANLFDLNQHLQDYLAKIASDKERLSHLKFEAIFNKTDDLKKAIGDVFQSLYEAIAITFLVVFAFLRKARPTVLISLSIPITLLLTIFILYARGTSLNILTLSGLILGIGMVVDSAVLVVSRVNELRAKGFSHKEAAARGALDVRAALMMSTLTNAAIFLPVAFIDGGDSFTDILKAFQVPIVASLAASLAVALLFLPIVMIHWKDESSKGSQNAGDNITPPRALAAFRWLRQHRAMSGMISVAVVVAVANQVMDINQTDLESPRDPYSSVNARFAPETSPKKRRELFETLEKDLLERRQDLGYRFAITDFNPEFTTGSILLFPEKSDDPDTRLESQDAKVKAYLENRSSAPGFQASLGWGGGPISTNGAGMDTFRFAGPRMARLNEMLEELKTSIKSFPGIEAARLDREESGDRNLVFIPNDAVLLAYGLDLQSISKTLSTMMSSASISDLDLNGKAVAARISFVPSGPAWTLDSLKQSKIRVSDGHYVNLLDLGKIIPVMFTRSINRADSLAAAKLYVYYKQGLSDSEQSDLQAQVRDTVNEFHFPRGYGPPKSDGSERLEDMQNKSRFIIGLSMLLIYLILAAMFESVFLPLAILLTVPLALLFGVAGLKLVGLDLDVMARLSLVILVGIGVNGAIILIDLIESLRRQGVRREEAVAIGCARRLKAVVMTASIQILSVLPVALGKAKIMGIPYSSLGVSIISGMALSTCITLIVLPMVYQWLDDIEEKCKAFLGLDAPVPAPSNEETEYQAPAA